MTETMTLTAETPDGDEYDFEAGGREAMQRHEAKWTKDGERFVWIDPGPTWVSVCHWDVYVFEMKNFPEKPVNRFYRFTMVGGGQLTVIERYRWSNIHQSPDDPAWARVWNEQTDLRISAHTPEGLKRYSGRIERNYSEMDASAAVSRAAPQDILDRAAATLRLLDGRAENFYALLDGAEGCSICGRPLRDEVSKLCAVGPDCARQLGIPHSTAAASKRLELRRRLLAQ